MKTPGFRNIALVVSLFVLPLVATAQPATTGPTNYTTGRNVTVNSAAAPLETAGTVTVGDGAIVQFRSNTSVTLKPGFSVAAGGRFRAFVFIDSDGDGMDDAWETRYGLNPGSAADASTDADADDLSNLVEYLLGTDPTAITPLDISGTIQLKIHRPQS